jgi:hypothetical protein
MNCAGLTTARTRWHSLTRAALSKGGRAKSKFLSVSVGIATTSHIETAYETNHHAAQLSRSVENSKNFPIGDRALVGQDGTTMNESQKQFSFTRGALSTCERRKSNFLIQERIAS